MSSVVVWDPSGEYWDGALVDEQVVRVLRARGVVALDCEPDLFARSGVGGFMKRSWGAGWPLGTANPRMHAPMTMYVMKDFHGLRWAARLVPDSQEIAEKMRARKIQISGSLRLAADSSQLGAHSGGFGVAQDTGIAVERLGPPDERGGWTVGGSALIHAASDGMFACALYGAAPGLRVAWAAVSQTRA